MRGVNIEFFIARRLAGRSGGRRNVMVTIATVTVAISIAVMIVSLAVIMGFKHVISDKLVGFGGHVQIVNLDGNVSLETNPITRNPQLEHDLKELDGLKSLNVYAVKGGIIKTPEAMQGIMLKGVDKDYDWTFFRDNLIEGELPSVGDSVRTKDIVISRSLARLLRLSVDDRVEILFIQTDTPPRRDRFKISGIYSSGYEELDMMVVPTDIRNVQRLSNWSSDQITGYEADTYDIKNLDRFSDDIYKVIVDNWSAEGESLMEVDVKSRYPQMFDWLKAHDVNAAVIIIIMILVALLNMISALLIILLERTRMIGVLKALGMNNPSLQKTFLIRSSYLILKGMVWGNIFAIILCLIQKHTGLIKLDQAGYFLSEVPIDLGWQWILALDIGSFIVIVALLAIPTSIISRIKPDTTIRYQ